MKMFSPFAIRPDEPAQAEPAAGAEERRKESEDIAQLRAQMAQMQEQLAALAAKK
jgi:polyhydroxyalkanoate synthesis regulator protein